MKNIFIILILMKTSILYTQIPNIFICKENNIKSITTSYEEFEFYYKKGEIKRISKLKVDDFYYYFESNYYYSILHRIDSSYSYRFKNIDAKLGNSVKYYSYNKNGDIVSCKSNIKSEFDTIGRMEFDTFIYNKNGFLDSKISYKNIWVTHRGDERIDTLKKYSSERYFYDDNMNLIMIDYNQPYGADEVIYEYNDKNNLSKEVKRYKLGACLVNGDRRYEEIEYHYDDSGLLSKKIITEYKMNDQDELRNKFDISISEENYSYNERNLMTKILTKNYSYNKRKKLKLRREHTEEILYEYYN